LTTVRSPQTLPNVADLTVEVAAADVTVRIATSGEIRPIRTVNLSPKTAGRLDVLYVEQGDRVTQGQLIARMDNAEIQARVAQAQAALTRSQAQLLELQRGNRPEDIAEAAARVERAKADVASAQARLDLAQERLARNQMLVDEGAVERDRLDAAIQEARSAEADLERSRAAVREVQRAAERVDAGPRVEAIARARADVAEATANLALVRSQLADTEVRAPFAGFISQKYAEPGSFVTPTTSASTGSGATSTSIAALANGLEVLARVPEVDIGSIQIGQTAEIKADAYPDRLFQGRVKAVAPEAVEERDVTAFEVRIELLEGLDVLRSGMNADITFLGSQLTDAIVVPAVAVVTLDGEAGVLVPGDRNAPTFRPVTLGSTLDDRIQVLNGLQVGERVFVNLPEGVTLESIGQGLKSR
jgi:HlyD family secretion protein